MCIAKIAARVPGATKKERGFAAVPPRASGVSDEADAKTTDARDAQTARPVAK
jgi:hypothetical protein